MNGNDPCGSIMAGDKVHERFVFCPDCEIPDHVPGQPRPLAYETACDHQDYCRVCLFRVHYEPIDGRNMWRYRWRKPSAVEMMKEAVDD